MALMVLAIAVQNTCPYGYSGKTAIAAAHVHDCPLKDHQPAESDGRGKVKKDFQDLNHLFVFVSPDRSFRTFVPAREAGPVKTAGLEDIYLNIPHRPPEG